MNKDRIHTSWGLLTKLFSLGLLAALFTATALQTAVAQAAPNLGTAQTFAVLGASTVTNTGPTIVVGDLGVSPGTAITGFPPGTVTGGTIHAADAVALQAQSDVTAAYVDLAGRACDTTFGVPTDLVGMTLVPGVYCFSSSASLTGALTLDGGGNTNAVWIFKVGSTLITGSNSSVVLINGGQECNDFWQVGSSATLGTGTTFIGNILALTSISLTTNATLSGRALARNGAVTMDSNRVSIAACVPPPVTPIPPTVGKAFSPAAINAGGNSTLTITLNNANNAAAGLTAPLIDNLPTGVLIAATPNVTDTCGGTVTANAGGSTLTLTGGSIPANGSCTLNVQVTAAAGGNFINSLGAGALKTDKGNNAAPAVATLTVNTPAAGPPTVGKAFSPAAIAAGGRSTLTITLDNPNNTAATLTAPFTDALPTGVLIASTPGSSTTCGGTLTANAGGSTITLSGSAIPANGSCTVTVPITAGAAGNFVNLLAAGALQTDKGNNAGPAVATLTVTSPSPTPTPVSPTLSKAFNPATIDMGGVSVLTITLHNSGNTVDKLTAPLVDQFPLDIIVSGNASNTCGGTVTAIKGDTKITLTGGSIPATGFCTVSVTVTTTDCDGPHVNTVPVGALQTNNGQNAVPAVAILTVVNPPGATTPRVFKTFIPAAIKPGGISTLNIYLINHSSVATPLTASFIDNLPSGVVVASGGITTCGGTVTAVKGSSKVTLTGGSIPANSQCIISVNVTATGLGQFVNKIGIGTLHTTKGTNAVGTVATLTVSTSAGTPPKLGKTFSPITINSGGTSTLTITLTNPNSTVAAIIAPFTDTFPNGIVVSGGASTSCGGTLTAVAGSSHVTLAGGAIPANGSCKITLKIAATASCKGIRTNTLVYGALQTNKGASIVPASASITVN